MMYQKFLAMNTNQGIAVSNVSTNDVAKENVMYYDGLAQESSKPVPLAKLTCAPSVETKATGSTEDRFAGKHINKLLSSF